MKHLKWMGLLVMCCMLSACGSDKQEALRKELSEKERRAEMAAYKIGVLPTLDCLPVYLAEQMGWLSAMPDSFRVVAKNSQIDLEQLFVKDKLNLSVSDNERVTHLEQNGLHPTVIGTTQGYWLLVSNKLQKIKKVNQLNDKMVAMARFSATDRLTDDVLKSFNTTSPTFKIQVNDVKLRLQMLLNNSMDAMWLPEPQATVATIAGHPTVTDSRKVDALLCPVFIVKTSVPDQKRRNRQQKVFVEAYNRACDTLNSSGLLPWKELIMEKMSVDAQTVDKLPRFVFKKLNSSNATDRSI